MLWAGGLKATDKYIALVLCHSVLLSFIWEGGGFCVQQLVRTREKQTQAIMGNKKPEVAPARFLSGPYQYCAG